MHVVLLPGIWPPDVGGPATHGPDFVRYLLERGHSAFVVTMADGPPSDRPCQVQTVSRSSPFPIRYSLVAIRGARAARRADVVYASATYAAAAAASELSRRPLVIKLVSDPAFERARRYHLFAGTLEEFQSSTSSKISALKRARTRALGRARRVVVPSEYLARFARDWGLNTDRIVVLGNPAPLIDGIEPEPLPQKTFVFAGRLTVQKSLDTALDAVVELPDLRLLVLGDGPERERLEGYARDRQLDSRVTFRGSESRAQVLSALAGAEASVLPSAWENFPHAAVESLAVGTPVVATAVGGVPEVVQDGVNGVLVPAGDGARFTEALKRIVTDRSLRDRLAANARESVATFGRERIYGKLTELLLDAAGKTNHDRGIP